jgi:hypothetical protein
MPETLVPEDLSEKQLKWGYWFVTHKVLLRRILIVSLIALSAGLLGFSGYGLVSDILNASERERMMKELAANQLNRATTESAAPRPLSSGNVQALPSSGKFDFIAAVKNPNVRHYAHFSYRFVGGDFATPSRRGFILPGEEKLMIELGFASASRPGGATLEISEVNFDRVDRHSIADWGEYVHEHVNFPISDPAYEQGIEIAEGKPMIGRTSFKIRNATGYGYYDLRVLVLMYKGSAIAAVNSTAFPSFAPGETKEAEVTWYEDYGAISQIKVVPEIDITDQASYMRP